MRAGLGWLLALTLVACATAPPQKPTAHTVEALAAAVQEAAERSEHEPGARAALAQQALADAQACLAQAAQAAACQYAQAVALGLAARVHPAQASALLTRMLDSLARAESADPGYDSAGPARVRALVLTRAPGWPLGPGDPEAALSAARRAVSLKPQYPPNWLALAEAQSKNGARADAQTSFARAQECALAQPPSPDRDDWLREAERGLQR